MSQTVNTAIPSKSIKSFNVWKGNKDINVYLIDMKAKESIPCTNCAHYTTVIKK